MHIPVLREKVLEYLDPRPNEHFIDCTAGAGGHIFALLERIAPRGKVLAIDWDHEAVERLKTHPVIRQGAPPHDGANPRNRLILREGNFADLKEIAQQEKFQPVRGILFDLGFSADQLEQSGRGFSFQKAEPLDMRYNQASPQTAEKLLNYQSRPALEHILKEYAEEQFAKQIAASIVEKRAEHPIRTTTQLVSIIEKAVPKSYLHKKIHPATKTFQALRIATNDELHNLKQGLQQAIELLEPGARIAVISFHSLEDRIVKETFKSTPLLKPLTKKPVEASSLEKANNPRARSAKLRVAEKQ